MWFHHSRPCGVVWCRVVGWWGLGWGWCGVGWGVDVGWGGMGGLVAWWLCWCGGAVWCCGWAAAPYVEAGMWLGQQEVAGVELVLVRCGRLAHVEAGHHHHLLEHSGGENTPAN